MRTNGKFILCTPNEFERWLAAVSISRAIIHVQNHHTFSPAYSEFSGNNHFELLKAMERYHVAERGFDMIAQNLTTFKDGTVAVCRPLDRIPAGIKGANQGAVCIEHLGNFNSDGDSMTDQHREAIIQVNAILCRRFDIRPSTDTILYHHWYDLDTGKRTDGDGNTKTCPGTGFFGGNSVNDAGANFLPLVVKALDSLQPTSLRKAEVVADSLNVRSGPDLSCQIMKQLLRGVSVCIFEENSGWCRIAPDRQEWVNGNYLQPLN